jgi:hypothetical protein
MNKGTIIDRVAAHTIAIQDSPVHSLHLLRNLVGMVKVSKKKECVMVLGKNQLVFRCKENSLIHQNALCNMKEVDIIWSMLVLFMFSHCLSVMSISKTVLECSRAEAQPSEQVSAVSHRLLSA